ncbi:MAG: peptidylprolyl isomerase [Bdellovibrionaceae bacterium]|nr:peptidylprolyl isomerase [Pseudobdellovibrionaceae bacterium]
MKKSSLSISGFLILTSLFFNLANAELVEKIVAIVNSEIILDSDFKLLQKKIKTSSMIDDSLVETGDTHSLVDNKKSQLDYLINEKILDSEVKRLNLNVTMEKVQQEIKEMAKRNNITTDEVLNAIKSQGMGVADYQAFLKTRMERQSLLEMEIISKIRVTEEDAFTEFLKKNPQAKNSISEYKIAHILFNTKKSGPQAAQERANLVYNRLKKGEKFEALAEQFSEDADFSQGGLLGTFKAGDFSKEIEDSIKNIDVGEVTPVMKTKQGLHIFKILEKKSVKDPKFEKEKATITSSLVEKNFKRQLKIWLQSKKDEAFIRVNK